MLKKDEAVKREAKLQALWVRLSLPGPAAIPWCQPWSLTPRHGSQATAQGRVSTWKAGKGQRKKQHSSPGPVGACASVPSTEIRSYFSPFRHVHCLYPPSHSCLETLSVRFTLYLLIGQGWHQTLYSSQGSALCMWLVRRGTTLQFRFLMNQHSLKRNATK